MKRTFRIVAQLAISLLALLLAFRLGRDVFELPETLSVSPFWLLLVAAFNLAILMLLSLRLRLLLALFPVARPVSIFWLARVNWMGLGAAQVALGALSGDALRVAALHNGGHSLTNAFLIILADRLVGLLGLVIIGLAGIAVVTGTGWQAATGLLGLLAVIPLIARLLARLTGRQGTGSGLFGILATVTWSWRGWVSLPIAATGHILSVGAFYAVGRGFGLLPPMPETLVAVPAGLLGSSLPISFGGWGVREVTISGAYQLMGTAFDDVVLVSILFGLSNLAWGLPGLALVVLSLSGRRTVS